MIANFLTEEFDRGTPYGTLAALRSAIASAHDSVDGQSVGAHPLVLAVLQGARDTRPPAPKYTTIWDPDPVLRLLDTWGPNETMTIERLSRKLVMLFALASQGRSSDLARIATSSVRVERTRATFTVVHPKERTATRPHRLDHVDRLGDPSRDPVRCLECYLTRSAEARATPTAAAADRLVLTTVAPAHPATAQTIAKWNLRTMAEAGIDTTKYKAHSTRAAATTAAIHAGASKTAAAHGRWRSTATMDRFYNRASGSAGPAPRTSPARQGFTARILTPHVTTRAAARRAAAVAGQASNHAE
jgi:hypothetical protein